MRRKSPDSYLSAKAAHALDKHEEALNFLDDAISERADYAQAIQLRVKVLSALGRYDEALADAERLLKETPDHEDYALLQAETLAAAGRCTEAESACQKVSELNPFNIEAHALLSRLAEQREDLAKAITHCDDAIALQPANPNLYDRRAALFRKNNALEAAEKDEKRRLTCAQANTMSHKHLTSVMAMRRTDFQQQHIRH